MVDALFQTHFGGAGVQNQQRNFPSAQDAVAKSLGMRPERPEGPPIAQPAQPTPVAAQVPPEGSVAPGMPVEAAPPEAQVPIEETVVPPWADVEEVDRPPWETEQPNVDLGDAVQQIGHGFNEYVLRTIAPLAAAVSGKPMERLTTEDFDKVLEDYYESTKPKDSLGRATRNLAPYATGALAGAGAGGITHQAMVKGAQVMVPWAASDSTVLPSGVISTDVIRPREPKPCATVSDCTSPS